jgi:acylphosphatase
MSRSSGPGYPLTVVRRHVWVSGLVHGVWFRQSCAEQARVHGVGGWVRNTEDGKVEAVFEGDEAAVAGLVAWCHTGPIRAEVTGVEVAVEGVEGFSGFSVKGWD